MLQNLMYNPKRGLFALLRYRASSPSTTTTTTAVVNKDKNKMEVNADNNNTDIDMFDVNDVQMTSDAEVLSQQLSSALSSILFQESKPSSLFPLLQQFIQHKDDVSGSLHHLLTHAPFSQNL